MKIKHFEWDERNIFHIFKHQVTPEDVEEACYNSRFQRKTRGGLILLYGQTEAGMYLAVVVKLVAPDRARVITARNMTEREKYFYKRKVAN